jgi:hypothetical protein
MVNLNIFTVYTHNTRNTIARVENFFERVDG